MTTPLWILAICSIIAGFVGMPKVWVGSEGNLWENFLKTTIYKEVEEGKLSHSLEWGAMILSVCIALLGIYIANKFYKNENKTPERIAEKIKSGYTLLLNKYYVDEIYSLIVIKPFVKLSEIFFLFDKYIVDGAVNGIRHLTVGLSHLSFAFDKYVVDGVGVNGTAYTLQWFQRKTSRFKQVKLSITLWDFLSDLL